MEDQKKLLEAYKVWAKKRLADTTVLNYHYWGRRVVRELGEINAENLIGFYSENPKAPVKGAVKSLAEYLKIEIKLPRYRVRKPLRQPKYLTEEEAGVVEGMYPERYKLALRLMHECGLRVSEAAKLRVEDVKVNELRIVVSGKGSKEYSAYPSNDLVWELQKHYNALPKARQYGYFFPTPMKGRQGPITAKTLRYSFYKIKSIKAHPHKFRHTFAIGLLRSGANLPTIQRALGHSHIGTTSLYTTVADADVREATSRLWKEKDRNPPNAPPALQSPAQESDASSQLPSRDTA